MHFTSRSRDLYTTPLLHLLLTILEDNRFVYIWQEVRAKETPYYYGVPASLVTALAQDKKVVLVVPSQHKTAINDLEVAFGMAHPVRIINVATSVPVILARMKTAMTDNILSVSAVKQFGLNSGGGKRPQSSDEKNNKNTDDKLNNIKKRLVKMVQEADVLSSNVCVVPNDGTIEQSTTDMLRALDFEGERDFASQQTSVSSVVDLKTCPPDVYLQHTVIPTLLPALQILDTVRPADPVEFLALHMLKQEQITRVQTLEAQAIADLKEKLTIQVICALL